MEMKPKTYRCYRQKQDHVLGSRIPMENRYYHEKNV